MKTEDENQPGGYARRRVQRGSVVVVRGSDEGSGDEATWVALVKKVRRGCRCSCGVQEAAAAACVSCTPGASGQLLPAHAELLCHRCHPSLQVYRGKHGVLRVDVTWFNRRSDIPAKEARRVKLPTDAPRQVGAGGCWVGYPGRLLLLRGVGCNDQKAALEECFTECFHVVCSAPAPSPYHSSRHSGPFVPPTLHAAAAAVQQCGGHH